MGKKAFVIVGLGFGDEGKGLATDYLCSRSKNPLVIRFNGGHQAGHTVTNFNGTKHIFSNFGSGTFRNVPTYWSKFCTFSPAMVLTEYQELKTIGVRPHLLVDYQCPVTTHYDVLYNRAIEATRNQSKHGSCGLGFGTTIERSQFSALNLKTQDLHSPDIFTEKLQAIRVYYQEKIDSETNYKFEQFDHDSEDQKFCRYVQEIIDLSKSETIRFINEQEIFSPNSSWETYVFEGAQGILLDMDFGFRPYVTRSNTTSKNALELLIRNFGHTLSTEIFYVTRSYQTRHGAGPFPNATVLHLINQESETNQFNKYQGEFRTSYLNINLLNYALKCDERFSAGLKKHLLITCLDQLKSGYIEYYHNNLFSKVHYEEIASMLDYLFVKQHFSFSPCSENIKTTRYLKK